jgi:hypothetical protein
VKDQGTIVLGITKQIEECRTHAVHCAEQATNAGCPKIREDFLRLEQSWLQLARSYERARDLVGARTAIGNPDNRHGGIERPGST